MKYKKFFDILGVILLFVGFVLAFLPHAVHNEIGLKESSHARHITTGMALVVLALVILVVNNKALKPLFRKKI